METVAAALYVRISRDHTGKKAGVERQERECRAKAASLGWSIVEPPFIDNDVSAYSAKRRPEYERLLAEIAAGRVTAVLAWHPDRLQRRPIELERYIDLSEQHGVVTATAMTGQWDLSTPAGRMTARQLGTVARYESEHRGERVRSARAEKAAEGAFHGGRRPYGYEPDGVTIREAEAAELRAMVQAVRNGQSLRSIVRDLNARGVKTALARGPWTTTGLKGLVQAPRVYGFSAYKGEVLCDAEWPAIIDGDDRKDVRESVVEILSKNQREWHRGGAIKWFGSGLYVCGVCKEPALRVASSTGKRHSYRCRNRDNQSGSAHVSREATALDSFVEEAIVARLSDKMVLAKLTETSDEGPDATALRLERFEIADAQNDLAEAFGAGEITRAMMATATKKLTERDTEISERLSTVGTGTPLQPLKGKKAADVKGVWYGPGGPEGDRTGGLSLGARRAILARIGTVTVNQARRRGKHLQPDGGYLDVDSIDVDFF